MQVAIPLYVLLPMLVLNVLTPKTASAQTVSRAYGDTIVEVIGLSEWSFDQLESAAQDFSPGLSLAESSCAVVLRDSVGFADAASVGIHGLPGSGVSIWVVLTVVEPADSGFIRYRGTPDSDTGVRRKYTDILEILSEDRTAIGYLQHGEVLVQAADSVFGRPVPASVASLRSAVRELSAEQDYIDAAESILSDGNRDNRLVAALVMTNFAEMDSAWHVLAEAVRTAPDLAASVAQMVMSSLAESGEYQVDWGPARDALQAILGGTNLFAYTPILDVLVQTGIDPELARDLAATNPDLLLGYAAARNPFTPAPAQRFLQHTTGEDHGADVEAWSQALRPKT